MTRIIGGRARGRRLDSPRGAETRPTGARVKQTLFDILAPEIPGCRFLDPFAGGGGIGLEALSRGAARAVLIDDSPAAVAAIRANQARIADAGGELQVLQQDARLALAALADRGARFDVVYLDPPYQSDLYEPLLDQLVGTGLLEPAAVVVAEHFHKRALPERIGGLVKTRSVKVGDHRLSFYRRSA
jgi:16S rRNA (guanine966-N2)-methyltransferase